MKQFNKNIELRKIVSWTWKIVSSKAFIGSLLFAVSLWTYTKLNEPYNEYVRVPFSVILPENRAIEKVLPQTVTVKVKGSGWDLFNLYTFNTAAKCQIDFSDISIEDSLMTIDRNELMSGLQQFQQCEPIDILPESMDLLTGRIESREIEVIPDVVVNTRDGFMLIGDVLPEPARINISGNEKAIMKIDRWRTESIVIEDVYQDETRRVELLDSLENVIKFDQPDVLISLNIEQEAEITIEDIPISIRGGSLPKNYKIIPGIVNVSLRGGVDQLAEFPTEKIAAYINFIDVINDSTGVAIPQITGVEGVTLLEQNPRFVRVVKSLSTAQDLPVVF